MSSSTWLMVFLTPFIFVLRGGGPVVAVLLWVLYGLYKLLKYKKDNNLTWDAPGPQTTEPKKQKPFEPDPYEDYLRSEKDGWRHICNTSPARAESIRHFYKDLGCNTDEEIIEYLATEGYERDKKRLQKEKERYYYRA